MTHQDSKVQAIHAPDLKKLMRAPTIEGFVARRSKFNKSVSFQRRTLNSPPYQAKLDDFLRRNGSSEDSRLSRNLIRQSSLGIQPLVQRYRSDKKDKASTDGMSKLLTRLGTIGIKPNQTSESEALAHGVGMILQNKMADIERAWETRLAALQQEITDRDDTIRQLTDYITHISSSVMVRQDGDGTDDDTELSANLPRPCAPPQTADGEIVMTSKRDTEHHTRSSSLDASTSGSDEDEPLFMRCTSIESIIHHSPDTSLSEPNNSMSPPPRSWPQQRPDRGFSTRPSSRQLPVRSHSIVDIGSSTDEDIYSFSSEEEQLYPDHTDDLFNDVNLRDEFLNECLDDDDEEEPLDDPERGSLNTDKLNSKDWEVQMLAQKLADEQREVARRVDRDIACGRLRSDLAQVHSALATENIDDLTDNDMYHLEALVETERQHLRQFTRLYSLGERPVLEEEFCPIYRSRSQQLVSRASEFRRAGSGYHRIHKLVSTLVSLPLSEQFLLDRLLHSQERTRRLAKQRSLGDEPLSATGAQRFAGLRVKSNTSSAFRRSQSMCSPPPTHAVSPQRSRSPVAEVGPAGETGPPTVSAMFSNLQRSMSTVTSTFSRGTDHVPRSTSRQDTQTITHSTR